MIEQTKRRLAARFNRRRFLQAAVARRERRVSLLRVRPLRPQLTARDDRDAFGARPTIAKPGDGGLEDRLRRRDSPGTVTVSAQPARRRKPVSGRSRVIAVTAAVQARAGAARRKLRTARGLGSFLAAPLSLCRGRQHFLLARHRAQELRLALRLLLSQDPARPAPEVRHAILGKHLLCGRRRFQAAAVSRPLPQPMEGQCRLVEAGVPRLCRLAGPALSGCPGGEADPRLRPGGRADPSLCRGRDVCPAHQPALVHGHAWA